MRMLYRVRRGDWALALDRGEAVAVAGSGSWSSHVVSALRCARMGRGGTKAARQAARSFRLITGGGLSAVVCLVTVAIVPAWLMVGVYRRICCLDCYLQLAIEKHISFPELRL